MKKPLSFIFVSFFILATCYLLLFLPACSQEKSGKPSTPPPAPVTVASAIKRTVPVQIRSIGNVEAYTTVSIKARTGGELMHVNFREGQDVNRGELLFSIDPRPYKTALAEAKAHLARDTALAKKAEADAVRYAELFQEQLVSRDAYENILANAEALKATIAADNSAVENAMLSLAYCSIYAPVSGRTGSLLVSHGNLIKANDDKPMVVINQIQPVYINFSLPEQYLQEIRKYMSRGNLKVSAVVSGDNNITEEGSLTFIDNTVDAATGTIRLKATFKNKDKKLWPGQFVNIVVTLTEQADAIVVPSQSIQAGQEGTYIFIVKEDLTVEARAVAVERAINGESVIASGLQSGEKVVTDGHLRLVPGAKVEIKN